MKRTPSPSLTRRQFLKRSVALAAVVAVPAIISASARGAEDKPAPSNRVAMGCIGLGIQGMGNMRAFRGNSDVQVVAVCDVHEAQRLAGKKAVDDAYENKACAALKDFRELMARKDIDAVQITAPDHWHALMALEAVRAGKHMYCEKPMGWSVRAAQAVRKAVLASKVVFQFGTQQRSGPKFRQACELVRNGKIGPLKTILVGVPGNVVAGGGCPKQPAEPVPPELDYDLWLGPAPQAPYCYQRCRPHTPKEGWGVWYSISDYCMGMIGNWGVHHLDIAQWGNGTDLGGPVEIEGTGKFPQDMLSDTAVSWQIENRYANGVTLIHMDDGTAKKHPLQQAGYGHGILFLGTEGWVHVDRQKIEASRPDLLKAAPGPNDIALFKSNNHHVNFIDSIKGLTKPAAPIEVAVRSDTLCNLELIAIRLKRKLRWDPAQESFVGDDEANRMLDRPMRAPWKV